MKKFLGISWLNGQLSVSLSIGQSIANSWTSSSPVDNPSELRSALAEAQQALGFSGVQARMLLDHRSLVFHVQLLPPAKGKLLHQLLARQVEQCRFFEEEAAWSPVRILPSQDRHRFLIALVPRSLVQQIQSNCESNGIQLVGIHPVGTVLVPRLPRLGLNPDEPAMIIANHAGAHSIVAGFGSGELIFARGLGAGLQSNTERLEQEINRTLHFVRQQFGLTLKRLYFLDLADSEALMRAKFSQDLRAEILEWEVTQESYAAWIAQTGKQSILNLASRSGETPAWIPSAIAAGVVAALAGSAVFASSVEMKFREREATSNRLVREAEAEAGATALRQQQQIEGQKLSALIQTIPAAGQRGVAELFGRYISGILPQSMRLTRLELARTQQGWELRLEGLTQDQGSAYFSTMEDFERILREGSFQVQIQDSTIRRSSQNTPASLPRKFTARPKSATDLAEKPFFLTGVIQ